MLLNLPEYQIFEEIYEGLNSKVYRGLRKQDNLPLIFKIFATDFPSVQTIGRYKLEYEITKNIISDFVINVYDFIQHQNKFIIVLEDIGGESLANFLNVNQLDLIEKLKLAIQISEGIGQIHAANIIHKDINPSNIIFNPETQTLKVIDFGIASDLQKETCILEQVDILEGTLAYISPEQTGRMNRSLDYRTDLYSMGVTFYQMFTGQLPFISNDPLELIHHHLALVPIAPHLINPEIPPILSEIILKLMSKTAEARYQSAWGVKADLENCLQQLQTESKIETFELAVQDIADKFLISEKLYGRATEVESLLAAFEKISTIGDSGDRVEMVLISGYSGIGKSRLVQEIYKPITKSRGYFISGKFDQYQRNIPYFAIIQAFQGLIKQLLTESAEDLSEWRSQLIEVLGVNSCMITKVIPSLELIIGEHNEPRGSETNTAVSELQNRFNRVLQNFIRVFASAEHPLVIFLDDLQWADRASLKLLQILATSSEYDSLLLLGAYRDNEVTESHPMRQMIEKIQQEKAVVHQLHLSPLDLASINQFIADTLHCAPDDTLTFAELVQKKTDGNPFFMGEFLKSLHSENLIRFNYRSHKWEWLITEIEEQKITDNVVTLMTAKIQELSDRTQTLLQIAACIGNQFELDDLVAIAELSQGETISALISAIATGLILPMTNTHQSIYYGLQLNSPEIPTITYTFVHDRIQQSAYSLISELDRSALHYRIGKLILEKTADIEEQIFAIVSQFRLGSEQINDLERDYLAQLNLIAGRKARLSYAYESALQYCEIGLELLVDDSWLSNRQLSQELYLESITNASLAGKFELVDQLLEIVNLHLNSIAELVKFIEVQIQSLIARNCLAEAIAIALNTLAQLGVDIPQQPSADATQNLLSLVAEEFSGIEIENVANLPAMSDRHKLAAMIILSNISSAVYIGAPQLYALVVLKQIELSLQFGNTLETAYAFSTYGLILCVGGEIQSGNRAADMALALMERFQANSLKAKIFNLVYHFVRPWQTPTREVLAPLVEGYYAGIESGDLEFAAYCAFNHCQIQFFAGENLPKVKQDMQIYAEAIAKLKQTTALNFHQIGQQAVLNWLGESANPQMLIGEAYNETERLPIHITAGDTYSTCGSTTTTSSVLSVTKY